MDMESTSEAAADAIRDQVWLLRAKMVERLGEDLGTDEDELMLGYAHDPSSGETVVGIVIAGQTYSLTNGELIVQRQRAGRVEYASVGRDGQPREWQAIGPPPSTAGMN